MTHAELIEMHTRLARREFERADRSTDSRAARRHRELALLYRFRAQALEKDAVAWMRGRAPLRRQPDG